MEAYCVKCGSKQAMDDAKYIEKSGRARYAGKCASCGTSTSVFCKVGADTASLAPKKKK
jgi:protein gp37